MTARYYVQDQQLWMIDAPGSFGEDSPVFQAKWHAWADYRDRYDLFCADVVAALRLAGLCEPDDREAGDGG